MVVYRHNDNDIDARVHANDVEQSDSFYHKLIH